jgi:hypothetical protein
LSRIVVPFGSDPELVAFQSWALTDTAAIAAAAKSRIFFIMFLILK